MERRLPDRHLLLNSVYILNYNYEGSDYQPYHTTTLPGSCRDSYTGDCGASPWSNPLHYQSTTKRIAGFTLV